VPKTVKVLTSGSFQKSLDFLQRMKSRDYLRALGPKYGPMGVAALANATPKEYGTTASSWYFEIADRPGYYSIHWLNSNIVEPGNIPVAVLIQYGHATGNGAYIQGFDYINPALKPIFDQIAADMWKEVTK
jgi:hypothetical protein